MEKIKMIIDANNLILGRLSSYVAKKALLGEKIDIVNCENSIITGKKEEILKKYQRKIKIGTPRKGLFFHRMPDRFVKRTIRGMLPYKKERGKNAFKNIKCYIGIPEKFANEKFNKIEEANISRVASLDYLKLKDLCRSIGAKI